jgi:hypothetical protein
MRQVSWLLLLLFIPAPAASASYRPGYSYWHGGYYSGCSSYPAGHYSAGYYYNHQPVHVVEKIIFPRYVALVPLVEQGSYGSYYVTPSAGKPMPEPAAKPDATKEILDAIKGIGGKMDAMSGRMDGLERRIHALESKPAGPDKPADPFKSTKASPVQLLYQHCASCHEQKSAAEHGNGFVMFVADGTNVRLGKPDGKGGVGPLSDRDFAKCRDKMKAGKMPPPQDKGGSPVEKVPSGDRDLMVAFLEEALKDAQDKKEKK